MDKVGSTDKFGAEVVTSRTPAEQLILEYIVGLLNKSQNQALSATSGMVDLCFNRGWISAEQVQTLIRK